MLEVTHSFYQISHDSIIFVKLVKPFSRFLFRYPKPGRTNPFVNVYISRVGNRNPRALLLQPPKYFDDKERLIYTVTWANDDEISLTWETRHQNYSLVSICDSGANCRDSLVMTEPNGWMDLDFNPIFSQDGRQFAMILSSEGYKHVNVINRDTNQRVPITSGEMVVTNLYYWDEGQSSHFSLFGDHFGGKTADDLCVKVGKSESIQVLEESFVIKCNGRK